MSASMHLLGDLNKMAVKQMICIRKDLNMRKGKMVAQGAHAAMKFMVDQVMEYGDLVLTDVDHQWMATGMRKICVQVDSESALDELKAAADAAGIRAALVVDSGLTEFHGVPTKTALALGPDDDLALDALTGGLQLY